MSRCRALEADDVTQEAFLRFYRARLDGRNYSDDHVLPLLLTIAKRLALNRRRRDELECRLFEALAPNVAETLADDTQPTYVEQRTSREQRASLVAAIQRLSALERECLHLRAEGQSLQDVGAIVGLPVKSVSRIVLRAIRRLRQDVDERA